MSQHLQVLLEARLVTVQARGRQRIYAADPEGLANLRAELDTFWSSALINFKSIAEDLQGADMTTTDELSTVIQHITVDVPQAHAFRVFTEQFDRIKPRDYTLLSVDVEETVFEPGVGGHVYDRGADGTVCRWARVLAFDPPEGFVISWDINTAWQLETDLAKTSEVEVRFVSVGDHQTRVEVEHSHLERHGQGWENFRAGVAGGWPVFLENFRGLTTIQKS